MYFLIQAQENSLYESSSYIPHLTPILDSRWYIQLLHWSSHLVDYQIKHKTIYVEPSIIPSSHTVIPLILNKWYHHFTNGSNLKPRICMWLLYFNSFPYQIYQQILPALPK